MTKLKYSLIAMLSLAMILCTALFIGMPLKNNISTVQAASAPSAVSVNAQNLYSGYYLESNESGSCSTGATTEPATYVAWYDGATLTLNGYNGGGISVGGVGKNTVDLTIKLKGVNTITSSGEGIFANDCENLVIDADDTATLNINVSSTTAAVCGISIGQGGVATIGSVTIKGKATLNIDCETTSVSGSYGIYAKTAFSIEDSANLSVKCKLSHENNSESYCIVSGENKPVFNTDGVVTLDISDTVKINYCISANNGIEMKKGTLICRYKPGEIYSYACSQTIKTAPEGCVLRENPYYLGETVIKYGEGHTVTVENGTDYYGKDSNQYVTGETVKIKTSIDGLPFKEWKGDGVSFANATQNETTFTMIGEDVAVRAVYDVFAKQPVFERISNKQGSISVQLNTQTSGINPIRLIKSTGDVDVNVSFSKNSSSANYTYVANPVWSNYTPAGVYKIRVKYNSNYFVSEPFEIDYSEKEPDGFNVKITDGVAEVGGSTISSAKKGETVTIAANDKDGFVFKAWEVVSGGVTLVDANSATTTFEMPECNVEIKATYKQLISFVEATVTEPVNGETINTTAVSGNTLYKVLGQVTWRDVAAANDLNKFSKFVKDKQYTVSVRITVTSPSDYAFDKNAKVKINGREAVIGSVADSFITIKYTFTATAEPLPKYTLTIENGTLEDGNTSGEFEEGEEIKVIAAAAPEGKAFVKWDVVTGEGYFYDDSSTTTTFKMGDSDVTIKAVYKTIVGLVELTVKTPVAGAVADNSSDLSYPTDKGYTATLIWYDDNGKLPEGAKFELGVEYYAEIEVSISGDYVFMDDTEAYLNGVEESRLDAFPTSFKVGEAFIATEKPIVYFDVKVTGGRAEIDEDIVIKAEAGKEITIIAAPDEGKEFDKWEVVSGGVTLANANSATTTFVMGNSNVEIKAVYKTVHVHTLVRVDEKPATCAATGTKAHYKCSDCNKLFDVDDDRTEITAESLVIAINPDAHNLVTEWTAAKEGHYHICKNVGCAVGHDEIQAHTPDRAEATETEPVKCTVCDYTITPVVGHTHNLTLVPETSATCTENGTKSHYICNECGHKFADFAAENEITDENTLIIRMAHRFGEWVEEVPATTESTGVKGHKDCEFCHKHFDKDGNEIEDLTIAKTPSSSSIEEPTENNGLSGGAIAGIVAGSVVVAGVGGFSIFWFVIKKKSFAELIAIFKK